ncbi:MAG: hypothetical protein ACE5IJ_07875 [Thermoplasmata archaeon]
MTTTIRVMKETLRLLRVLKEEEGAATYDELIRHLIKSTKTLRTSQRGKYPALKPFKRERNDRF